MKLARILITGFEPFGGDAVNPSAEVLPFLSAGLPKGARLKTAVLPVSFARCIRALTRAVSAFRPHAVVSLGVAPGRVLLSVERVALNLMDARIPDNDCKRPKDKLIERDGPAARFATLPVKEMLRASRRAGVAAELSYSAGTYVCNRLLYGLLGLAEGKFAAGFVHVSPLPKSRATPGMSVTKAAVGLRAMLKAVCRHVPSSKTRKKSLACGTNPTRR